MKFLCVPCDEPMKLAQAAGPDRGSVSLVYACPACGYEMAMLTNPHETQVVGSLGVQLGPQPADNESRCPFSGMVQQMTSAAEGSANGLSWTPGARARLQAIPEFVRPLARSGVEKFARDRGYAEVTESVLEEARSAYGM
jgi:hypothetical protein